jgi:acyl dehydratase
MPIDVGKLLAAEPVRAEAVWDDRDVQLYQLALGAGVPETDQRELRYVLERDPRGLAVLPTFGTVAGGTGGVGFQVFDLPGVDIDLAGVLHGGQEVIAHRPLPSAARGSTESRVVAVYDKGSAAVVVQESELRDGDGNPLITQRNTIFIQGEGGFGGDRGPSGRDPLPEREPDLVLEVPTMRQQALLYRLTGDWNPLHADPGTARAAGYDRPILHGLCSFGIGVKALTGALLDGDPERIASCRTRFAGIFYPGETLRLRAWREGPGGREIRFTATAVERADAVVLSQAALTAREG